MKNTPKSKAECHCNDDFRNDPCLAHDSDIISRMEENQARFGSFPSLLVSAENERRLQLQDRKPTAAWIETPTACYLVGKTKPSYWDRIMSDPNRQDRYDDALLEAHMEAQRRNEGEDE